MMRADRIAVALLALLIAVALVRLVGLWRFSPDDAYAVVTAQAVGPLRRLPLLALAGVVLGALPLLVTQVLTAARVLRAWCIVAGITVTLAIVGDPIALEDRAGDVGAVLAFAVLFAGVIVGVLAKERHLPGVVLLRHPLHGERPRAVRDAAVLLPVAGGAIFLLAVPAAELMPPPWAGIVETVGVQVGFAVLLGLVEALVVLWLRRGATIFLDFNNFLIALIVFAELIGIGGAWREAGPDASGFHPVIFLVSLFVGGAAGVHLWLRRFPDRFVPGG